MRSTLPRRLPTLLTGVVLALAACGDDDDDAAGTSVPAIADPTTATAAPASTDASQTAPAQTATSKTTATIEADTEATSATTEPADTTATTGPAETTGSSVPTGPRFRAYTLFANGEDAITYDPTQVPGGADLTYTIEEDAGATAITLDATGMRPDRGYAVHAHVNPCGPTGEDAGPHYQHVVDPAATPDAPSVDPAYANPQNEFWLDLRTGPDGAGSSTATVAFTLDDGGPQSIVVHADEATMTAPGMAGMAGARIACITIAPA